MNFKDFLSSNREIKYFSLTLTEFKDLLRWPLKFKTFQDCTNHVLSIFLKTLTAIVLPMNISVLNLDLEISWGAELGGWSSRPLDKGQGFRSPPKNFSALWASVWSKNNGVPPLDHPLQLVLISLPWERIMGQSEVNAKSSPWNTWISPQLFLDQYKI